MNTFVVAIVSIAFSVAAQFCLKAGMSGHAVRAALGQPQSIWTLAQILTDRFVLAGFTLYGLGALVWLGVLSRWDVSKAYPLVGLGFVLTAGIGFVVGEQVSILRIIGVALICTGVVLVGRS